MLPELIDQARKAITENSYPLFVAEGESSKKKSKIQHNAYLFQCSKKLTTNANQKNHCFFIFGHSLHKNDDHILNIFEKGRFQKLYVSIVGDPDSKNNKRIIKRAKDLSDMRSKTFKLSVAFYDSATANVWKQN